MKQLGTYCMLNLLSSCFVCPRAVNHKVKLLQPGFNNSGISGQNAVSVAHQLLDVYLKISLEDASPSCLWSQHLWGAVEASTLPFISSWLQEKGQGQGGFEPGAPAHVSLLAQPCFRQRLSPYSGYCYALPLWLVCHSSSWLTCQETLPSYRLLLIYTIKALSSHHW